MKKSNLIFLLISLISISSYSQSSLEKAAAKYFKVNPLDRKFSVFLKQVIDDTLFVIDKLEKRTDSISFYLRGHYKTFNPFIFKPGMVQFIITEVAVPYDSLETRFDTIMVCQITALTDRKNGKQQQEEVKNQFKFFQKKYGKGYITGTTDDVLMKTEKVGEMTEYYATLPIYLPVISIFWGKVTGTENFAFSVIIRIKIKENFATLPVPPYRS